MRTLLGHHLYNAHILLWFHFRYIRDPVYYREIKTVEFSNVAREILKILHHEQTSHRKISKSNIQYIIICF